MNTPFHPPMADVQVASKPRLSAGAIALRLVILIFCSMQFVGLAINWNNVLEALKSGYMSPAGMAASYTFTFALMLAALLLLFSRKLAFVFFWIYVPYQTYWIVMAKTQQDRMLGLASLGIIAAILLYCRALNRAKKLK